MPETGKYYTGFHQNIVQRIKNGYATNEDNIYNDRLYKWFRAYLLNIFLISYLLFTSPFSLYFGLIARMISVFSHIPKTKKYIEKSLLKWQIIIGIFIVPYIIFYIISRPIYLLIDIVKYTLNGNDISKSKLYQQTLRLCIWSESYIQLIYLLNKNKSYKIPEFNKLFYHSIFKACGIYYPTSYEYVNGKWNGIFPDNCDILIKPIDGAMGYNQTFWTYNNNGTYIGDDFKQYSKNDLINYVVTQSNDDKIGYDSFVIQNYLKMNNNWSQDVLTKYHILLRISTVKMKDKVVPFFSELTVSESWTSHNDRIAVIYCDVKTGDVISNVNNWFNITNCNVDVTTFKIPNKLYLDAVSMAVKAHTQMIQFLPNNIFPDHSWDILISHKGVAFLEGSYFGARCTHYMYDSFDNIKKHMSLYGISFHNVFIVPIAFLTGIWLVKRFYFV